MNFSTRLIVYYLAATLLVMSLVGMAVLRGIEHYGMAAVEQDLMEQSRTAGVYVTQVLLLEGAASRGLEETASRITNNLSAGNRSVRIYDANLNLLSASVDGVEQTAAVTEQMPRSLNHALAGDYAYLIRNNQVYFAAPIELQGKTIGVLEFVYPLNFLNQVLSATTGILLTGAVVFGILITLLSIYIARVMVKPIKQLVAATERFAHRDFYPVKSSRSDELGRLSRSFNEMGKELQDYIQRQRQFVSNVSHELRTPLTAIKGYAEYLTDEVKGRPDLEKAVYHLNNESARLARLVDQLLLLSRIDAEREELVFSQLNLTELIEETVGKMQMRANKHSVTLNTNLQPDVCILGNSEKLTQVVVNLLDNAIKFSAAQSQVEVNLYCKDKYIYFTVSDRGPGIPPEDLKKVFDRFYRAANARVVGGTGLGLAIAKEIIDKHKGHIEISNRQGGGTVTTVKLLQH
ncbi:sensor histidine kinase [Desulfofalx alkaliphila]|uniref:sensor histidine kinase n=1 Tax=Desulfofalx alkaliphila TaxID=105483 RepID=UPI0004E17AD0|nr:HAMP domain-containing sensor histidine kinase [Desulfofalx alkaliphila]